MFGFTALRVLRAAAPRAVASTRSLSTLLTPTRPSVLGFTQSTNNLVPLTAENEGMLKITESPVLRALQVRYAPRDTFNPSHRTRKRRHGFLARLRTRKGRATLKRRQLKGRRFLSH